MSYILKILLITVTLLSLNACVSSNFFVLSTASQPTATYEQKRGVIGVEKVVVPKYLFQRELAVAKSSSQVTFLSGATWAEDLNDGLTHRLISFFQKKFNQPNVYAYPWDVSRQPDIKVNVQVSRFIAQGGKVYLDVTWELENMRTHKRKAKLFSTTVPTSSDASAIVDAMDKAFTQLEEDVAFGIKKFSTWKLFSIRLKI